LFTAPFLDEDPGFHVTRARPPGSLLFGLEAAVDEVRFEHAHRHATSWSWTDLDRPERAGPLEFRLEAYSVVFADHQE
jgi:hypothetical protein